VRRERDPDDGRSVRLWATPRAEQVMAARREFRRNAVADGLGRLAPADRRRIDAALPALRRLLFELDHPDRPRNAGRFLNPEDRL
jgi:DNA-binding MarR family transcriptional regulator